MWAGGGVDEAGVVVAARFWLAAVVPVAPVVPDGDVRAIRAHGRHCAWAILTKSTRAPVKSRCDLDARVVPWLSMTCVSLAAVAPGQRAVGARP